MTTSNADRWFRHFKPRPDARLRLFCFPHAGGGASLFRTWWQRVPEDVEVVAVQLPGREDRHRQPPARRMGPLIETLGQVVAPRCDVPYALVGHSMGGLIAFELARQFRRLGHAMPVCLSISGRRAPQIPDPMPPIEDLPDAEFARELQRRYGAIPDAITRDPEVLAFFLPTVRADLELVDTYEFAPEPPLESPIVVFGGTEDTISKDELAAWQAHTAAACRVQMLPGNHLFIQQQADVMLYLTLETSQSGPRKN